MSEMFFDEDPLAGMEFTSLPDHDAMAADNIVSQTQAAEAFDEPPQQEEEEDLTPNVTSSQAVARVSPPAAHNNDDAYVMDSLTTVDGHGMWTSWTRVFDQPKFACFDLLDNCLDATLNPPEFDGKVVMKRLHPNGMVILNNSSKPIKALRDVLVVYGSSKGKHGTNKTDAIGENGVGLKHGCATLSNSSFVLTRNFNVYSMGVIAKTLQTRQGVCLPSFEFAIDDADDKTPAQIETELYSHLQSMLAANPKVSKCVQIDLGQGDLSVGIKTLVEHCQVMWNNTWEQYDHVFQVLITSLLHSHDTHASNDPTTSRRSFQGNNPAAMFLQEIRSLLPKFYINIPLRGFEFIIENERVQFSYWQHRLVELTKFNVHIPKETAIADLTHMNWDKDGYPLSIYCGFEAERVADRDQANAAHMYIYSRASGRLIQIDDDARATLGLAASGSDYQQGLTLIIDDVGAELPLMPTKQGIAWSEQRGGETHKRNLLTWVAGVAYCFWNHHAKTFQSRCQRNDFKTLLNNGVLSMADPIKRHLHELEEARASNRLNNNPASTINRSMAMERLELADFTWFRDIDWKKSLQRSSRKWKITKTFGQYNKLDIVEGSATIFKFTKDHYPEPPQVVRQALQQQKQYAAPSPVPSVAQARAAAIANAAAAHAAQKKRRLSNGAAANQPILLLDDDEEALFPPAPIAPSPLVPSQNGVRRQVARKSTGAPSPQDMMRQSSSGGGHSLPPNPHSMEMQRRYNACHAELERQKQAMANERLRHRDQMAGMQHQLHQAHQHNQQLQLQHQQLNGHHHNGMHARQPSPPPNYQANLQKVQDELTIVQRQKNKLQEELREIKDQRATEVSGLNLEIEGLRMKLEQQDETIQRLQRGSVSTPRPDDAASDGLMTRGSLMASQYGGTDSI